MVVLVEAAALERDPNLTKHLGDVLLRPGSTTGALGRGVIGEGLNLVELFAALLASVLVSGHRRQGLSLEFGLVSIGPERVNHNLLLCVPPACWPTIVLVSITVAGLAIMVAAYFSGSFPTASAVGMLSGHDHNKEGSGNPGASNVWRTSGAAYGVITMVVDILKGILPVVAALLLANRPWAAGAWAAATIGHVIPIARWRNGGKGVATGGGGALVLFPLLAIGLIGVFALSVRITKRASVGSLLMTVLLVAGVGFLHEHTAELVAAVAVAAVIIFRHRANIARLLSGDELKVG